MCKMLSNLRVLRFRHYVLGLVFMTTLLLITTVFSLITQAAEAEQAKREALPSAERSQTPEWIVYTRGNSGLPHDQVYDLAIDAQGTLWVGTMRGLAEFDGEAWTVYNTTNSELPDNQVTALAFDAQGTLWVGTGGGLAQFDGETWTVYTTDNSGLSYNAVNELAFDAQETLWIGTGEFMGEGGGGLAQFDGETWTVYTRDNSGLPNNDICALAIDAQGNIWVGPDYSGFAKFDGETWTVYTRDNSGLPHYDVNALAFDAQGNLWIATNGGGLAQFDGEAWTVYTTDNSGLPDNQVPALAFDAQGNLWVGTVGGGLAQFDGETWTVYTTDNSGLSARWIWTIVIDAQGNTWIGTKWGGLAVYREGGVILPGEKARDVKRKADLQTLQIALELYFDNEEKYPLKPNEKIFVSDQTEELNQVLVGPYLPGAIQDPSQTQKSDWPAYLCWQVDEDTYFLFARLENEKDLQEKPLPPDGQQKGKRYQIDVEGKKIEYNYWLTNIGTAIASPPSEERPEDSSSCQIKFASQYAFEDFPTTVDTRQPAPVDFTSNPEKKLFITRITEEAQKGPNFAGHYTFVFWGCGTECQASVVVDTFNGKIYEGLTAERGFDFKINSNLLIVNPPDENGYHDQYCGCTYCAPRVYLWQDGAFKKLEPKVSYAEAIRMIRDLPETQGYLESVEDGRVDARLDASGKRWVVRVYQIVKETEGVVGHIATANRYYVDKETGQITKEFSD